MIDLLFSVASAVVVLLGGGALMIAGLRAGDRPGETTISAREADPGGGIRFTIHNPGRKPVLLGATVRRTRFCSWLEGDTSMLVCRRISRWTLLAARHTVVCLIEPGATEIVSVPYRPTGRRAQLVVTTGESGRLRVYRRTLTASSMAAGAEPSQLVTARTP